MEAQPLRTGREQKVAPTCRLEIAALLRAESKRILELRRLARPLRAEKHQRGIGRHHRALVGAEQVAGILGREGECDTITYIVACARGIAQEERQ